jgi:YHS domain-containing protein
MRAKHGLCCMAILGVCMVGSGSAQQAVQWQPTLETAKRVAGQTGRLVLIHFWDDGCRPCQIMEQTVYSRPDVAAVINRDFVAVKVKRSHFPSSASQYGVSAVPADVIIAPQGQLIDRRVGAVAASEYMSRLGQVASNWRKSSPVAGYAQNSSSPPQGRVEPRPAEAPQVAGGVPYARPPAVAGQANGFAAKPNQRRVQDPPAMGRRYPGGAGAGDQNRQFAARGPELPSSSYSREALQPAESRYSPPLANNAAPSFRQRPDQAPYSHQQPPQLGPQTSTSAAVGNFASDHPGPRPTQRRPLPYESNRQPAPRDKRAVEIPAGNPPVALDGYCPVQLTEKKRWVLGNRRWGLRHEGRTYLFAGPDEQRRFNERPHEYAPVMSGSDVVLLVDGGQTAAGRREHGVWFMGRIFLFSDEASFQKFEAAPDYYANAVEESVSNVANRNAAPPASGRPREARN